MQLHKSEVRAEHRVRSLPTFATTMNDDESVQAIIATIKVSSILQGMWDNDDSTTSTSSLAKPSGESETNDQRVQQVETRLLQLVDQIPVPDTPNKKEVEGQNFLESPATKLPVLRPACFSL